MVQDWIVVELGWIFVMGMYPVRPNVEKVLKGYRYGIKGKV